MIEPPVQRAFQANPGPGQAEIDEEEERNLPSELRSRPKILRTPAEGGVRSKKDQDLPQHNQLLQNVPVKIKGVLVEDDGKIKEHGEGFAVRERIVRTPPEEAQKRADDARRLRENNGPHLNDYYQDPETLGSIRQDKLGKLGQSIEGRPVQYANQAQG